jgi:Nitroreductase family
MQVGQPFLFTAFGPNQRVLLHCCKRVGVIEFKNASEIDKNPDREKEMPLSLNETLRTIKARRSIRLFTKQEVSDADTHMLLQAANEAPSAWAHGQ